MTYSNVRKLGFATGFAAFVGALGACSLARNGGDVQVRIGMPKRDAALASLVDAVFRDPNAPQGYIPSPATVDDFDCYAVNVFGPGVGYDHNSYAGGGSCPYMGLTSTMVTPDNGVISLKVPSGPQRTFQMIGIATGKGCPADKTIQQLEQEYWAANPAPMPSPTGTPVPRPYTLSEIGKTTTDLFKDTRVEIQNTYAGPAGGNSYNAYPFGCPMPKPSSTSTPLPTAPTVMIPVSFGLSGTAGSPAPNYPSGGGLPLSGTGFLTGGDTSFLEDPYNGNLVYHATPNTQSYARLDVAFNAVGYDLSLYRQIRVELVAGGGSTPNSSGCQLGMPFGSSNGAAAWSASIYRSSDSSWQSNIYVSSVSDAPVMGVIFTPYADNLANYQVALGGGTFFHVSIVSQSYAHSSLMSCSALALQQARLYLMP